MEWNYSRQEQHFEVLPVGDYRVRLKEAERAVSKNGNDMLVLKFEVSGTTQVLYHYIVFMPDRPEITNRNLTQFFDSFKDIQDGDTNSDHWVGKVGAVHVKHEEYNGEYRPRIQYFIPVAKQGNLAPWQEPGAQSGNPSTAVELPDDVQLPF